MTHREHHESEGLFTLKAKPGPGFCLVKGCRKACVHGKMSLCHAHWQFRWRMKSPKRSAYTALRDHAVARKLEFSISFDYFTGLCDAHRYFEMTPETKGETLTIDRIDITKGYVVGNLAVVSHSENVIRGNRDRFLPAYVQAILARKRAKAQESVNPYERDPDANPF